MIFYSYFSFQTLTNCYIIGSKKNTDAVIIDPGVFDLNLLKIIEDNKLYIKKIFVTHSHKSHIAGIRTILKIYDAKIYSYRHSIFEYKSVRIRDMEKIDLGEKVFEVLETPGHSGDSITFRLDKFLFTGDSLFAGTIGPTTDKFEKGLLLSTIKEKILNYEDDCFIFPGHGPPSKLGIEKKFNIDLLS